MTTEMELISFLRSAQDARLRQLDEDEQWARAASQAYPYAEGEPAVPETGVHWTWVKGENWEPTQPDPVTEEWVGGEPGQTVNLATVEQWPVAYTLADGTVIVRRPMPQTYADSIVEMDSSAAGHIARWDPARVLAEIDRERKRIGAERQVIELYDYAVRRRPDNDEKAGRLDALRAAIGALAQPYAGHPDWRDRLDTKR